MAQPKPDIDFLFPAGSTKMDVTPWARAMTILDHDKDPCYIVKVEYCKRRKDKEHEFLVIDILHAPTGHLAHILVDRSPKPTPDNQPSSRAAQMSSSSITANDQVAIEGSTGQAEITSGFVPYDILATLTFGERPTLLDFSTTLVVVHEHASKYDPVDHQCYWFAHMIWCALSKAEYRPQIREEGRWNRRGMYSAIAVGKDSQVAIEDELRRALIRAQEGASMRKEQTQAHNHALREEGFEQGREEGFKQGRAQGCQELEAENAHLRMLLRQLEINEEIEYSVANDRDPCSSNPAQMNEARTESEGDQ